MDWNRIERIVAAVVFLAALTLYLLTVAPTASFWDSGEFIAIANQLQVSHPPGAPFYMLIGRLFSMFVPTAYISLAVNLVSVVSSALTVLLTHLIIVRLTREWQENATESAERITALTGGVIGALTFAATDSFWFNAVEAEVYAMSMLFTAAVVWLIMRWSEQARREEASLSGGQHPFGLRANRYLVLIAYLFGLAIGVHLLNLLAIFFIALIFFFTEFERPTWSTGSRFIGLALTGVVSVVAFLAIYPGIIQWLPGFIGNSGAPIFFTLAFIGLVAFGVYFTHARQMQVANLVMLCVAVVLIGYSTYALIFIRSAADPPIDENDPETIEAIVSYLKREQYGDTPILRGATYDNRTRQIDPNVETSFPRRYSPTPAHMSVYAQYESDWDFFWKYQVHWMYVRYFLWNFVGRGSDEQDAPAVSGFTFIDDPDYGPDRFVQTPSEQESRNVYYGLPLLLGLLGAAFHFMRDWRRAFSVLVLFFVTGLGIILYLNQTPLQPRERDYSYVASFFAFSLWVGIGATGVLQLALEALRSRYEDEEDTNPARFNSTLLGIAVVLFLAVPAWMTAQNYYDHDRSGRYVAPEYAHNMLMSVADDAILITNGDNDTFPLWYLQEVEGVRRDVRVVNISLLNTPWYIKQLKNQHARDSEPLPISMPNDRIDNISVRAWEPREVELPVDVDALFDESVGALELPLSDTNLIESPMRWHLEGRPYPYDERVNMLYVSDQALLDILETNARQGWKRPFYFAVTVSQDGQLDLEPYFQLEGQAFRVVPIKHDEPLGRVVPSITPERLMNFKFTNLNDPDVYFDENIRRMIDNYRNVFAQTSQTLALQGDTARAETIMDTLMANVPFETIPGTPSSYLLLARVYNIIGAEEKAAAIMKRSEPVVLERLAQARTNRELEYASRFVQMLRFGYMDVGDFDAASAFSNRLADLLGSDDYRQTPDELRQERDRLVSPQETPPASDQPSPDAPPGG